MGRHVLELIASEGPPVEPEVANAAPIVNVAAAEPVPAFTTQTIPGLPPEAQPLPGDILLSRAFWPWEDLGAEGIPEHWLYMARRVQGVIAMLSVQTPGGPKLVNADVSGRLAAGSYYDRDPLSVQLNYSHTDAPTAGTSRGSYTVPNGRKALIEIITLYIERKTAAAPADIAQVYVQIRAGANVGFIPLGLNNNTVGTIVWREVGQSGFLDAVDSVEIFTFDNSTGGLLNFQTVVRLTEFDA